jgi:cytochrome b561
MKTFNRPVRYGAVAQSFHWLTVILVAAAYLTSAGGNETQVYSAANDAIRQTHETIGFGVMVIALLRLMWRLVDRAPDFPAASPWMRFSARVVQIGLYGLLVALPVSGIVGAWLEGHPLTLYGFGNVGPALPPVHDLGLMISNLHTVLGNMILWLAGVHAAAALFHHFVLRDRVLASMLPGRS